MSTSSVGTCSNCGGKQFWLSDTLSLQMDDGQLKYLPHPAESGVCEAEGLTLAQAGERGRLYRETFYICRNCGKDGATIERQIINGSPTFTVGGAMKWGWGLAVMVVPFLIWMRWWQAAWVIGFTLLGLPGICWWENRKAAKALAARGLPKANAPGRFTLAAPLAGSSEEMVTGQIKTDNTGRTRPTGPCCDKPDWIEAGCVKNGDRIPCPTCGRGVMGVSDHAIH